MALEIARTLGTRLTAAEKQLVEHPPTKDAEAYDLYLRGVYYLERGSLDADNRKAKDLFESAIGRDASFALAHAFLTFALNNLYPRDCAAVGDHARRALALAPDLPDAHMAIATFDWSCVHDRPAAIREGLTALRGAPGDAEYLAAVGDMQVQTGDDAAGLEKERRAFELDPNRFDVATTYAYNLIAFGRFDEAERVIARLRRYAPDDPLRSCWASTSPTFATATSKRPAERWIVCHPISRSTSGGWFSWTHPGALALADPRARS